MHTGTNNATGFQLWCKELDLQFYDKDVAYFGLRDIVEIPCHGEFYKYAQWHSLVEDALDLISHPIPILTIYYEDYEMNLMESTTDLLRFLELDFVGRIKVFKSMSNFSEYFTAEQKASIKDLIHGVASTTFWKQIQHYF